jgi:aryl-alcohol dehydrogenase-like predicted oxidoreductase
MQYHSFGRTGWNVSTIGFGAWEIGGEWGEVDDNVSLAALNRAVEL